MQPAAAFKLGRVIKTEVKHILIWVGLWVIIGRYLYTQYIYMGLCVFISWVRDMAQWLHLDNVSFSQTQTQCHPPWMTTLTQEINNRSADRLASFSSALPEQQYGPLVCSVHTPRGSELTPEGTTAFTSCVVAASCSRVLDDRNFLSEAVRQEGHGVHHRLGTGKFE